MVIVLAPQEQAEESVASLVVAAQAGQREALGKLIERYQSGVYAIVYRRLRNDAEAQETTQEVFLQVLRKLGQLRDPACFGGWLKSTATRMAINRAVRAKPVVSTEPEILEATQAEESTPYSFAIMAERKEQVHLGLSRLGDMDRETLEAFYLQGQSLAEMSDGFRSPIGTIKRRLHVARKRLAKELETLVEV